MSTHTQSIFPSLLYSRECFQGKIIFIVEGWAFLLFLGAADCELLCNSRSEKANSGCDCSVYDPPRMGNVSSVKARLRHSFCIVFPGDRLLHRRYRRPERSEEFVGYVDAD